MFTMKYNDLVRTETLFRIMHGNKNSILAKIDKYSERVSHV